MELPTQAVPSAKVCGYAHPRSHIPKCKSSIHTTSPYSSHATQDVAPGAAYDIDVTATEDSLEEAVIGLPGLLAVGSLLMVFAYPERNYSCLHVYRERASYQHPHQAVSSTGKLLQQVRFYFDLLTGLYRVSRLQKRKVDVFHCST
jgi:hypothetical protein